MRVVLAGLLLAVFGSALQLVLARHESRRLFVELQELEKHRDAMIEEWGRLQLEEATWSTHARVEELARVKFDMRQPTLDQVVLVTP